MKLQAVIEAAHNLRPSDNDLPLKVMVDNFYGSPPTLIMEHLARVYFISSLWYKIMSMKYAKVARPAIHGNYVNVSIPNLLMGSSY